jgi:hypothetical protein
MKRYFFVFMALTVLLFACGSVAPAQPAGSGGGAAAGMDLVAAVKEAASQMELRIPPQTRIALVSVASSSAQLSEYVISRLEAALVGGGKLVVVDRSNLDKVRAELGFQLSGEVDDESAKSIGKLLGAGAIVTGAFTDLGDAYDLTLKAINIETATVAVSYPADIAKTTRIETLLASGGGAAGARQVAQAAPPAPVENSGERTAPAPSVPKQTLPAAGTYTLLPQPVAYQGTTQTTFLISKIEVRGNYMTLFLINTENKGMSGFRRSNVVMPLWDTKNLMTIKDLDIGRTYNPIDFTDGFNSRETTMTFENVMARRFSLTGSYANPPMVFDEIIIGAPD